MQSDPVEIYVVMGMENGVIKILLATSDITKAKRQLMNNGWDIEVWEDGKCTSKIVFLSGQWLKSEVN